MAGTPDFFLWTSNEELGNAVMTSRKALGLSRGELAARAGVGMRFLYDLERGKGTLRIDKVRAVLSAVGLMPLLVPSALAEMLR